MKKYNYLILILMVGTVALSFALPGKAETIKALPQNNYPSNGWMTATPEEVGMNPVKLDQMEQFILDNDELGIDSVSIVKNGYLCYENYYEYYNYSNLHNTFSVAKSVIGTLIGIANTTGMIPNLDEPVVEIFANRTIQNRDTRKEAMTIRHLLAMRSGLEVNDLDVPYFSGSVPYDNFPFRANNTNGYPGTWIDFFNPENDFARLINSSDWVQFALDRPMTTEPGTEFYYSDTVAHLLSAIIQEKTGMETETFAKQYLFDLLNITEYLWWKDPSGLSFGGGGLWLTPNDMLKIGYLYLNNGEWNTTQIIPETWIQESTQDHNPSSWISGAGYGYGYQWWLDTTRNYYNAEGLGQQLIIVNPENDLVAVITAWGGSDIIACPIPSQRLPPPPPLLMQIQVLNHS
ncbi:MAG: serine hydrolase domain-containing protein [Candidatus Hodarchaeales archaeon]|jgi:CubicO group peptidase (beta-lactamase class C family)